jgi:hypothetical protein
MTSFCLITVASAFVMPVAAETTPERRALDFLAREVPRWSADNKCFSCHNNGDAARALLVASRQSHPIPAQALTDTIRWLAQPERWDKNGGNEAASDKVLARIQFAAALGEALESRLLKDRKPLELAAESLVSDQGKDGAWKLDAASSIGSPATYGTCLATHMARHTLLRADPRRFRDAIARADRWFRKVHVVNVLDAAAVVLALESSDDAEARAQRKVSLELIRKGENKDGGWGPYVNSSPEPFDTALVMLALVPLKDQEDYRSRLQNGRKYLLATQRADGSWPETTRPAGAESYAQRLSTTGWATLALLATQAK